MPVQKDILMSAPHIGRPSIPDQGIPFSTWICKNQEMSAYLLYQMGDLTEDFQDSPYRRMNRVVKRTGHAIMPRPVKQLVELKLHPLRSLTNRVVQPPHPDMKEKW